LAKKRKKKKKSKKKKSRTSARPSTPQWYIEGLGEWSTGDILAQLTEYGLAMDEKGYLRDTDECDEPSVIAARWIERVDAEFGRWQDFFHFAARELWKRFLPQRDCFDLLMDDLSKHIERTSSRYDAPESRLSDLEVKDIMKDLDRLDALLEQKREREGKSLNDLLEDLFDIHSCDLNYWIVGLPLELSVAGFVDAAVTIARRYTYLDPGNMLGDLGQILASSGRCQEALVQAEENVKNLSYDAWVIIKAGDVYDECGQTDRAIELYRQGLDMADDQFTKDGVYERLLPLYQRLGMEEEANELEEQQERDRAEFEDIYTSISSPVKKVGRNAPCPCGSGKKSKKCCLNLGVETSTIKQEKGEKEDLVSQQKRGDDFIIMIRDIHHRGSWDDLSTYCAVNPHAWDIRSKDITRLKRLEKQYRVNLADKFLSYEDLETIARAITRIDELKVRLIDLETPDRQLSPDEQAELWTIKLILSGEKLPDEIEDHLIRLGDVAAAPLIQVATDEFLHTMTAPGRGWASIHAVRILGEMRAAQYTEQLIGLLGEEGDFLREEAMQALLKVGEPTIDPLLKIVREKPKTLKQVVAAEILAELPPDERIYQTAYELIKEGEPDELPYFFPFAVDMLKHSTDPKARDVAKELLEKGGLSEDSLAEIEDILASMHG
jgi:tetratricopeptide (TPR) repeat protein